MRARVRYIAGIAVLACCFGTFAAFAQPAAATQFNPNPWRGFGFLNMAHQGGENEAPSSTLFAFKSAVADRGADMLELDVNLTSDNRLVVIHNDTVNSTTQETGLRSSGTSEVNDLTLAQVQALDAGYSFRGNGIYDDNHTPESDYTYRGMRTGATPPPAGYTPDDFAHPTIEQVLDAFPNTPINIEIKMIKTTATTSGGCQTQNQPGGGSLTYCDDPAASMPVAEALAGVLNGPAYRDRRDILVVSFADSLVNRFNELDVMVAPQVAIAPGTLGVAQGVFGGTPNPDVSAFQIPPRNSLAPTLPESMIGSPGFAQQRGYAVHVFTETQDENNAAYQRFTNLGVEGVMSSNPSRLHAFLCTAGIRRPDGSPRCPGQIQQAAAPVTTPATTPAAKKCKKAKKVKKGKKVKKAACAKKKKEGQEEAVGLT